MKAYQWHHPSATDTVKPGQHFLVEFRNRALVITEQVLANVGLILSEGLCLLSSHRDSMKAALEVN